jgi:hypothetical protein
MKPIVQGHGIDVAGAVLIRKRISRAKVLEYFGDLPRCLVGIEACPSAHHWRRELQALGHTVRLIPQNYVKAYLRRSKNDANDAAAICEAVTRPNARMTRENARAAVREQPMPRARTQTPPIMARGHDEPRAAAPRIERATPHMTQPNAARGGGGPPMNARAQMPAPAAARAAAPATPHGGGGAPHINTAPRGGGGPGGGGGHGQDKRQ